MSESEKHLKKIKKHLQAAKNRQQQIIFQHAEQHERGRELERERAEEITKASKASSGRAASASDKPVWSARMQDIRNKLDGKKRMADDRWNRFAGTDGAGGMGR